MGMVLVVAMVVVVEVQGLFFTLLGTQSQECPEQWEMQPMLWLFPNLHHRTRSKGALAAGA